MSQNENEPVQLKLRFSERLRARIEAAAKKADRSMNNEIVRRLEQSFEREDQNALVQETASAAAKMVIAQLLAEPGETASITAKRVIAQLMIEPRETASPGIKRVAAALLAEPGKKKR